LAAARFCAPAAPVTKAKSAIATNVRALIPGPPYVAAPGHSGGF
jgi:hypothetical protein